MTAYIVNPNGNVVTVDKCNWMKWSNSTAFPVEFYSGDPDKGGRFICSVPAGSIPMYDHPAKVEVNAAAGKAHLSGMLNIVLHSLRGIEMTWQNKDKLSELKLKLKDWNRQRRCWVK